VADMTGIVDLHMLAQRLRQANGVTIQQASADADVEHMLIVAKLGRHRLGELTVGAWTDQSGWRSRLHLIRDRTGTRSDSRMALCGVLCAATLQTLLHEGPCARCIRVAQTRLGALVDLQLVDAHAEYIYLRRSIRELAFDFGISPETLRERFKRARLPTRSSEEANRAMGQARRKSAEPDRRPC